MKLLKFYIPSLYGFYLSLALLFIQDLTVFHWEFYAIWLPTVVLVVVGNKER